MKKNIKLVSLLVVTTLLITGCGKVATLQNGEDAVATFNNEHMLSVDELYNSMKLDIALENLLVMSDTYILEDKFKDEVENAENYVLEYMASMLQTYGTEADVLAYLQQGGYSTIEAFESYLHLNYLQSHAIEEYAKEQVTEDEIEKYYDDVVKQDIEVSHILIMPTYDATTATEDDIEDAKDDAKAEIENIIDDLKAADKDGKDIEEEFAKIAEDESDDSATASEGGDLGRINNYNTLTDTYDELVNAAYELKDGEYSTEIIETELGYHVILRTKSHDKESLEDLTDEITEVIASDTMTNQVAFDAQKAYRDEYGFKIEDSELADQYSAYLTNQQNYITSLEQQ